MKVVVETKWKIKDSKGYNIFFIAHKQLELRIAEAWRVDLKQAPHLETLSLTLTGTYFNRYDVTGCVPPEGICESFKNWYKSNYDSYLLLTKAEFHLTEKATMFLFMCEVVIQLDSFSNRKKHLFLSPFCLFFFFPLFKETYSSCLAG